MQLEKDNVLGCAPVIHSKPLTATAVPLKTGRSSGPVQCMTPLRPPARG